MKKTSNRNSSSTCKTKKQGKVKHSETVRSCARCRNHGLMKILKSHKIHCIYKDCQCLMCHMTFIRQKVMARKVATKRASDDEKMRLHQMEQIRSAAAYGLDVQMNYVPQIGNFDSNPVYTNMNYDITISTSSTFSPCPNLWSPDYVPRTTQGHKIELLLEYSHRFEEILPKEESFYSQAITLRYIILKSAKGDPVEAMRLITEAVTAFNLKSSWDTILTQILSFIIYLSTT